MAALRAMCDKHGILLIADEVSRWCSWVCLGVGVRLCRSRSPNASVLDKRRGVTQRNVRLRWAEPGVM